MGIKYTPDLIAQITEEYNNDVSVKNIALHLAEKLGHEVPERSIIAKLSSLGVYRRKEYLTKRGEPPTKKEEYIERIAALLDINLDLLESLEKVTKSALVLIESRVKELKE